MDLRFLYAIILSILPVSELRGGIPLAVLYAKEHGIPIILAVLPVILANILIVFFIFFFFDNLHHILMKKNFYRKFFEKTLGKLQKKVDRFEEKYNTTGFVALMIFVAIPLPGTGAWTGALISWLLDLDRKKSLFYISLGVIIAGIIVTLATLGVIGIFL